MTTVKKQTNVTNKQINIYIYIYIYIYLCACLFFTVVMNVDAMFLWMYCFASKYFKFY